MESEASPKLQEFRKILKENDIDGYIVPHYDAHFSEYLSECDERLKYISEFQGSNGIAFISSREAICWTDSRYYIQAMKELANGWQMKKMEVGQRPWFQYVYDTYEKGTKIGYDPQLITADSAETRTKFFDQKGIQLIPIEDNLIDKIWGDKKPSMPDNQIIQHEIQWTGFDLEHKLLLIADNVKQQKAEYFLSSKLDEIAWVLNLRGSDIPFNPVFFSYLLVKFDYSDDDITFQANLYIKENKISEELKENLIKNNVNILQYDQIKKDLENLDQPIVLSKTQLNYSLYKMIKTDLIRNSEPIIENLKAIKNKREIQGFRDCHIRDGVAMVSFLSWLEKEIKEKNETITEFQAAEKSAEFRKEQENNMGLSFETISSTGPNAAIIHYKPTQYKSSIINPDLIYLIDSGGQYLDGTTDITRTIRFNKNSESYQEEKEAYTRVLKGNIDLERVIFPKNKRICGADLDILARRKLWEKGMDYGHGTGHGVGYFLNVHEGPQGISKYSNVPFVEGMIVSNEPGYYKEQKFGVRIENLILVVRSKIQDFLTFENLTLCPYDKDLIDTDLLDQSDINFINQYHQRVFEKLSPQLQKQSQEDVLTWLKEKCSPL